MQVNKKPNSPFKIKSFRKTSDDDRAPAGAACSIEAGGGSDKPPC